MSLSFIFLVLTSVVGAFMAFTNTPYSLGSTFLFTMVFLVGHMGSKGMAWYPLAMFLVYVGALMVLFLYMSCLSPNTRIEFPYWGVVVMFGIILLGVGASWFYPYMTVVQSGVDMGQMAESVCSVQCPGSLLSKSGGDLVVAGAVSLFVSLLSVVKICKHGKGPLRPFKRR